MSTSITAGAVIYAKNLDRVSTFYAEVTGLKVTEKEDDYVVLESSSFQLVVLQIPSEIASAIEIANPPVRREDAAVKPIFLIPNLSIARTLAAQFGGELNPAEQEWQFQTFRVCDGRDPEGNVIQLRELVC
ncbi:VOC domain-containing protein [Tumidithrix helvetica PCC 7403]|uniref:hypothetical protein n=1 Tax=Tumidithrix helvetica TaxID=3457545 RepID=UPI003CA6479D